MSGNAAAVLVHAGTMSKAVAQSSEGTTVHNAMLLGEGSAKGKATAKAGPIGIAGAHAATGNS